MTDSNANPNASSDTKPLPPFPHEIWGMILAWNLIEQRRIPGPALCQTRHVPQEQSRMLLDYALVNRTFSQHTRRAVSQLLYEASAEENELYIKFQEMRRAEPAGPVRRLFARQAAGMVPQPLGP